MVIKIKHSLILKVFSHRDLMTFFLLIPRDWKYLRLPDVRFILIRPISECLFRVLPWNSLRCGALWRFSLISKINITNVRCIFANFSPEIIEHQKTWCSFVDVKFSAPCVHGSIKSRRHESLKRNCIKEIHSYHGKSTIKRSSLSQRSKSYQAEPTNPRLVIQGWLVS